MPARWRRRSCPTSACSGSRFATTARRCSLCPTAWTGTRPGHSTGLPFLAPWANRLSGWSYEASGVAVDLRGLPLHTDGNGHPIHGTMGAQPGWEIVGLHGGSLRAQVRLRRSPRPAGVVPVPARDRGRRGRRRRVAVGDDDDHGDGRSRGSRLLRLASLPAPPTRPAPVVAGAAPRAASSRPRWRRPSHRRVRGGGGRLADSRRRLVRRPLRAGRRPVADRSRAAGAA